MKSTKYLAIQQNGSMRIVAKLDSMKGGEIPVRLTVDIPDTYWTCPVVAANISLPDRTETLSEIEANIHFAVKEKQYEQSEEVEDLEDI